MLRASLISFDVFDTLIKRSVAKPSDLFALMEEYRNDVPSDFAQLRKDAERSAAAKKQQPATLEEIYAELSRKLDIPVHPLMELEIELELAYCQQNPECVRLYRQCLSAGKKVILISDMYLPASLLERMLEKCGVTGYHKLYVSCECGARKADGSLFRLVLDEWKISPYQLFHIGDNVRSDIVRAAALGILTGYIKNDEKMLCAHSKNLPDTQQLEYRTLSAIVRNAGAELDGIKKLGCETLGPILLGFTLWLSDQLRHEGIDKVYFMSRDGYVMKRAFDLLEHPEIQSHYLYCSRRSYTVPLLWTHPDFESIFRHITIPKRVSLERFLIYIGLEPEAYHTQAEKYGLSMDRIYESNSFFHSSDVRSFYQTIRPDVERNSRKEYDALLAYIRQTGMQGKVAVVDIGRHGTMQNALQQLIHTAQLDIDVTGYYVGVSFDAPLVSSGKIKAKGYLHHLGKGRNIEKEMAKFVPIFESVFLAQHGSVRGFKEIDGKVGPVLYPYEYESEEGKYTDEIGIIQSYQEGALQVVRTAGVFCDKCGFRLSPEVSFARMARMGTAPTLEEAKIWGDFRVSDMVTTLIAHPGSIRTILADLSGFKKKFMLSGWKIGFMRRMLKIQLPYDRMYMLIQKAFHRSQGQ